MGNPQFSVRLPADWVERLETAGGGTDLVPLIKAMLKPLVAGMITIDQDDAGNVLAITGRDAARKKVTIRCDGKPIVRGAEDVAQAPARGRPKGTTTFPIEKARELRGKGLTLKQIGEQLGITRQAVFAGLKAHGDQVEPEKRGRPRKGPAPNPHDGK